jgi:chromosome segregation ATPase
MANDLEDSRQWRGTVESRLSRLEARVEEEARLRAAMDKDLSGVRVEKNVLQAIQKTQSDHTGRLTRLEEKVDTLEEKVGTLDEKIDLVHAGIKTIRGLLGGDPGSGD